MRRLEREACDAVAAAHLALGLLPPPEHRSSTASAPSPEAAPLQGDGNASPLGGAVQQLIVAFKVRLLTRPGTAAPQCFGRVSTAAAIDEYQVQLCLVFQQHAH